MASWNLMIYFSHRFHTFFIRPETSYEDLMKMIRTHFKLILDHYFLEIYDIRYRTHVLLNEEYIRNIQNRLPRTSVNTLNGRIRSREGLRNHLSTQRKRRRTSLVSTDNDHLIIWLDRHIGHPDNCRELKRRFCITTMVGVARPLVDYECYIDQLIQTDTEPIQQNKHLTTFSNRDECLYFLEQVESRMKILFITSNFYGEEIVPLIVKRVQMIYILVNDTLFSREWTLSYRSNLLIFDDKVHLLVRLIRDLAQNFVDKAALASKSSVERTIIFLRWARKLINRAIAIDSSSESDTLHSINRQLERLELTDNDKDEKYALECDEG